MVTVDYVAALTVIFREQDLLYFGLHQQHLMVYSCSDDRDRKEVKEITCGNVVFVRFCPDRTCYLCYLWPLPTDRGPMLPGNQLIPLHINQAVSSHAAFALVTLAVYMKPWEHFHWDSENYKQQNSYICLQTLLRQAMLQTCSAITRHGHQCFHHYSSYPLHVGTVIFVHYP